MTSRGALYFAIMAVVLIGTGIFQSWNVAFGILMMCMISAIMALGVNIQWGYGGLLNFGVMGFTALGGLTAMLVSYPPVPEAWAAGGGGIMLSLLLLLATVAAVMVARRKVPAQYKTLTTVVLIIAGFFLIRVFYLPAVARIEAVNPGETGFLGGLGMPIIISWVLGGLVAAGAAWLIGKVALGLRADYLAIATLGIAEIIIAILKYEDWLTRGVKNVTGLPRPAPPQTEVMLAHWFVSINDFFGMDETRAAVALALKVIYVVLFLIVLVTIFWFSERALKSPWGRMMRAIRDNRDAAAAMGKNVTRRHLQVFVLGCAVVGVAGAMLTTLDGQLTPTTYIPLRYTFLVWVMVILGGSGNNWGAVLGGFIIWFVWVQSEPFGHWFMANVTMAMSEDNWLRNHLISGAVYMRYVLMGLILLTVLRFAPRGLIPERSKHSS